MESLVDPVVAVDLTIMQEPARQLITLEVLELAVKVTLEQPLPIVPLALMVVEVVVQGHRLETILVATALMLTLHGREYLH
jgi:hypothetical protein